MAISYEIRHALPGRLRLRTPELAGRPDVLRGVARLLNDVEGVHGVRANTAALSLVVEYDATHTGTPGAVFAALATMDLDCVPTFVPWPAAETRPEARQTADGLKRKVARSLLAIGVAGWLLPVVPGTPFVIVGILLLGKNDPLVRAAMRRGRSLVAALPSSVLPFAAKNDVVTPTAAKNDVVTPTDATCEDAPAALKEPRSGCKD